MNNLENMCIRLNNNGGQKQQDRMIADKQKTLERAVKYSYQAAKIQLLNSNDIISALMNPNKLLEDYDEKILSVNYGSNINPGTIFKWNNPTEYNGDTYWIVYLQDLTELAYFRANVRRCEYTINWKNNNIQYSTYASIIGPKQEKIASISRSQFNADMPNYTISMLIPMNNDTVSYFKRYTRFYLQDLNNNDNNSICWRVESIDSISLPGLLQIHAREYYANDDTDDITNGIVDGKHESVTYPEGQSEEIVGDTFIIKPKFKYKFKYQGKDKAQWEVDENVPVSLDINDTEVIVTWNALYSGQFILRYGNQHRLIIVESMFH